SIYYANSIENVNAGSGDDTITCSSVSNVINCGAGADSIVGIATGDTINAGDGNDGFSPTNTSFTLIDGGAGSDTLYLYHGYVANSSGNLSGYVDLRTFTDAQLTNIENIDISIDGVATSLIVTKDSINNLEGTTFDVDGDGDQDNVVYITASTNDKILIFPDQGWAYAGSNSTYYFYSIDNNQTWFAWNKTAGNILYIFNSGSPRPVPDDYSDTNPDNDTIPIGPIDDDGSIPDPTTPDGEDNP
ncbi:uncharacterized protein METZ01_LOCUS475444, partial [marine metagenome]